VNDVIPIFDLTNKKTYSFSGKRISRGQYKSSTGVIINADLNGEMNYARLRLISRSFFRMIIMYKICFYFTKKVDNYWEWFYNE
jgi:hypothetical protein